MSYLNRSNIPWCTHSWSPMRGCAEDGECSIAEHCWAKALCWRFAHNTGSAERFEGLVEERDGRRRWTGLIREYPEALDVFTTRQQPRVVFVAPHGDLALASPEFVRRVFEVIAEQGSNLGLDEDGRVVPRPRFHEFVLLTKRPVLLLQALGLSRRGRSTFVERPRGGAWHSRFFGHLWLGVSVSTQAEWDERVGALCDPETGWPGNRFVSAEPCFSGIDCGAWFGGTGIHWVIAGSADSIAHGAAKFTPGHARSLRDQCAEAGVPYWLKQMPGWVCTKCDTWVEEEEPNCPACDGPLRQRVLHAPWLTEDGPHLEAPPAIADILQEAEKLP